MTDFQEQVLISIHAILNSRLKSPPPDATCGVCRWFSEKDSPLHVLLNGPCCVKEGRVYVGDDPYGNAIVNWAEDQLK